MLLLVMLGAAVGAPSRWLLDQASGPRLGTRLPPRHLRHQRLRLAPPRRPPRPRGTRAPPAASSSPSQGTGLCGGFAGLVRLGYETIRLTEDGARLPDRSQCRPQPRVGLLASAAGWWLATR